MRQDAGNTGQLQGTDAGSRPTGERARHDFVAFGIALAALILFVGTAARVLPEAISAILGFGGRADPTMTSILLLNIAVLLFGWRRYSDLRREVDQRRQAEAEANHLADTDALTGCLNRRSLLTRGAAIAKAHSGRVALLLLDLDNFKHINDVHGHRCGDEALRETASRIRAYLRHDQLLARLGGDEFACVVPLGPDGADELIRLAGRLVDTVRQPCEIDGVTISLSVSMGIASTPMQGEAADDLIEVLLNNADIAMYQAKKQGKDRFACFEASMQDEKEFRERIERGIRHGLRNREFVPFYQQQIELESGAITGFEMLARWNSEDLGSISPEIFIPIAEEMGVIGELSEQLLEQAFEDATAWDAALSLSVNISPVQLRDPWFAQKILKLLHHKGLQPSRLDIEISERCLHENLVAVQTMVASLRNQGVKISLDDFGMSYANLARMHDLPFDRIKIDHTFVAGRGDAAEDEKLMKAIIALGQSLGLPITAEGIESEGVLSILQKLGEIKGQGFLYGQPADARETLRLLSEIRPRQSAHG